jgi:hypothetical protein
MNWDFNVKHYKKKELEDIFELDNHYDNSTIENKENIMRNNIIVDKSINNETKQQIFNFLGEIKNLLTNSLEIIDDNRIETKPNTGSIANNLISTSLNNIYERLYNTNNKLKMSNTIESGSTSIIETPKTPYSFSFPSEYYTGTLNPLERRTITKNLTINTTFRDNYYSTKSTNFMFDLPIRFVNVLSMQLNAIEFPTTFYNQSINEQSNFFNIIINGERIGISVPNGNYTPNDLVDLLNQLTSNFPDPFNKIVYSLNINKNYIGSGQMIIGTNPSVEPFHFIVDFQSDQNGIPDHSTPLPLKLGWMMGFRNGIYENNSSYVSEGITDLIGIRYVFLSIDEFCNNKTDNFYSAFNNSLLNRNILARISSTSSGNFNYQSQNNLNIISDKRYYFGSVDINKIQIQLLDAYGRVIDLNNMDFSFSLTLQTAYNL